MQFRVERRYTDKSFRESLLLLTRSKALDLFDQTSRRIRTSFVEPLSHLTEDVFAEQLGGRVALVEGRDVVDHPMIERAEDLVEMHLQIGEINHHPESVELARLDVYPHPVVVAVSVLTAPGVPANAVRRGERIVLEDGVHAGTLRPRALRPPCLRPSARGRDARSPHDRVAAPRGGQASPWCG